jgi:hypothetical protein
MRLRVLTGRSGSRLSATLRPVRRSTIATLSTFASRYAGAAAAILLAVGAVLAGALPDGDPGAGLRTTGGAPLPFWVGLACWLAGTVGLLVAWWRLKSSSEARWLVWTGVLWALPLLAAPPLASRDVYSYACQGWLHIAGADPYAVGVATCPWVDAVAPLWRDTPAPYGPAAIGLSAVAARIAVAAVDHPADQLVLAVGLLRLFAIAGVVLAVAAGRRLALAGRVPPAQAVWLGLLTPLVAVHAISGAHHDALMAGLVVAGLAATRWSRLMGAATAGSPRWAGAAAAGAFLALATAVKATAVVAVPFAVILMLNRPGVRSRLAAAAGSFAGVFAAVTLLIGLGFGWIGALAAAEHTPQWTSIPSAVGMVAGYVLRGFGLGSAVGPALAAARLVGLLVLGAVAAALVVYAWRRRDSVGVVVACCAAAFAAVAVLSPVFYPWYALTPVAVAAATAYPRWVPAVAGGLCLLVLPNGLGLAVLTKGPGAIAVTAVVVYAVVRVIRTRS